MEDEGSNVVVETTFFLNRARQRFILPEHMDDDDDYNDAMQADDVEVIDDNDSQSPIEDADI